MRRKPELFNIMLVLLLSFIALQANATERSKGFWSFQLENDYLADFSDNQYTHGFELSYVRQRPHPAWLRRFASHIPLFETGGTQTVAHTLGQKIFTPVDISDPNLIPDDRPYAGWLYTAFTYSNQEAISPDILHLNMLEFSIGLVGPDSGAEAVQRFIHDLVGAEQAQGWSHQLNDEPTLGFSYIHKWRIFDTLAGGFEFEASPHTVLNLGNAYTYLGGGVMFRWGRGLRNDIGPPNIRPGFPGSAVFSRASPSRNWYLFLGHETRLVLRNIFLDGNSFSDSHSVTKEPLVGDLQFGLAFHLGNTRISFSETVRTKEFTTQDVLNPYSAINFTFYL